MSLNTRNLKSFLFCIVIFNSYAYSQATGNSALSPIASTSFLNAASVVSTVRDTSAAYYNPAGLAYLKRDELQISASAYSFTEYSEGQGVSSGIDTIPSFVGSTYKLDKYNVAWFYTSPVNNRFQYSSLRKDINEENSFNKQDTIVVRAAGIGFAPKRRYEDLKWGLSLVGLSLELNSKNFQHNIKDPNATTERVESIQSSEFDIQAINFAAIFGLQYKINSKMRFGIKYQSPSINALTTINFYSDQVEIKQNAANDVQWSNLLLSDESEDGTFTIADNINIGLSYKSQRWLTELVVTYNNNANQISRFQLEPNIQFATGNSTGTPPTTGTLGNFDFSSQEEPRQGTLNINVGTLYYNNESTTLGFGVFTDFSPERDGSGVDIFGATLGTKVKSKYGYNFLGLMYRTGVDKGGNTREANGEDIPVDITLQSATLFLSSSVYY
jgi:hypothetical protein